MVVLYPNEGDPSEMIQMITVQVIYDRLSGDSGQMNPEYFA